MNKVLSIFLCAFALLNIGCDKIANEAKAIQLNEAGLRLLSQDRIDEAIKKFKGAATLSKSKSTQTTCWRNVALSFARIEKSDSARVYFDKASKTAIPFSYENLVNKAEVQIIDGKMEKAIKNLKLAVSMKPKHLEANNTLGLIYYGEYDIEYQDLEKALKYNKLAFKLQPEPTTRDVLAKTFYLADSLDQAKHHFEALKQLYPDYLDYDYYLGLIEYEKGNVEEGRAILNDLIAIEPEYYNGIEYVFEDE